VLGFVLSVLGILTVAVLLFLGASLLLGRGETRPPADLDRSPVELPDDRPVTGDDVRALRMSVAVRGYRMSEVDWLLEQFAQAIDERDAELIALRAQLRERAKQDASAGTTDDEGPTDHRDGVGHDGATTEDDDEETPRA
jgi:DivIVA domain-containing protein